MFEWLRRQTRNLLDYACVGSNPTIDASLALLWKHTSIEHGTNHSLYKGVNMSEWFRKQNRNLAPIFFVVAAFFVATTMQFFFCGSLFFFCCHYQCNFFFCCHYAIFFLLPLSVLFVVATISAFCCCHYQFNFLFPTSYIILI